MGAPVAFDQLDTCGCFCCMGWAEGWGDLFNHICSKLLEGWTAQTTGTKWLSPRWWCAKLGRVPSGAQCRRRKDLEPKLLKINPHQAHLAVGGGTNTATGWGQAPARVCCATLFCTSQRSFCSSWRRGGSCLGHGMLGNASSSCCCREPHISHFHLTFPAPMSVVPPRPVWRGWHHLSRSQKIQPHLEPGT